MRIQVAYHDTNGIELNIGDWLKLTGKHVIFYVEFKFIENNCLQPFDNYVFDKIEKVKFKDVPKDNFNGAHYFETHEGVEYTKEIREKIDHYRMDLSYHRSFNGPYIKYFN